MVTPHKYIINWPLACLQEKKNKSEITAEHFLTGLITEEQSHCQIKMSVHLSKFKTHKTFQIVKSVCNTFVFFL